MISRLCAIIKFVRVSIRGKLRTTGTVLLGSSVFVHKNSVHKSLNDETICKLRFYFADKNNKMFIRFIKFFCSLMFRQPQNRFYFLRDITFSVKFMNCHKCYSQGFACSFWNCHRIAFQDLRLILLCWLFKINFSQVMSTSLSADLIKLFSNFPHRHRSQEI